MARGVRRGAGLRGRGDAATRGSRGGGGYKGAGEVDLGEGSASGCVSSPDTATAAIGTPVLTRLEAGWAGLLSWALGPVGRGFF